jgi:ankyrin repeat protein
MQGSALILAALMRAGANVNERDEDGMTPVMWAANRGYQDVLQILLDYGADINAQDSRETKTALMWAAPERLHIVEYLLSNGADPKIRTKDGLKASEEALQQATREQQGRPERAKMQESKARFLRPRER